MITTADILKASILIVDDQVAHSSLLEQILTGAGYASVTTTNNPREVCELHRKNHYSLILLDLQMPGMDGFQVMEGLKVIETGSYLPVLVLTAQPDHKLRALKAGARDFLSKPFDLAEVLMRVHNMIEVRLLHREAELRMERAETSEQAISGSELRYRRLFEAAQDGILILNVETGRITDVNPFLCNMLGLSHAETIGNTVAELRPFKGIESNQAMLKGLQLNGFVRYENLALESEDGRHFDVQFICSVYHVGTENVIQCNIRDITDRKRAEIIAFRLGAIVEFSEDAVIGKDLNSTVTSWNKGAEKIFGYTAREMVGTSITRLIPPDRQEEELKIMDRVKRGENVEHFETLRVAKDGHLVDVSVTVSPIKDKTGKIAGASKVARDITERKRTAEARRMSETRYRTLFDHAPNGIVIADSESIYIDANPGICRMLGYTREELIGLHASDIVAPTETSHIGPALSAIKAKSDYHREWQFRRKNGAVFPAEVHATMMPDGNLLGMISDITERRAAEGKIHQLNTELENRVVERTTELEVANKELEAFSYSVSHDLRAPLRAVDGFSQAVLEDYGPLLPPEGQNYLKTIREGAQQMGTLIDDLLAFSRLSRAPLNKQTVNTGNLVSAVLEDLNSEREGRQIEIRVDELPSCQADPALLKQVWTNLLSNAVKYTRQRNPAKIEIGCKPGQENVYFVRDNGAGFDMRYVHKLFGVFQRLHRADQFEGTGVGLAIVQRVIHRHGGRIWVEATVNGGATFYFTLKEEGKL